MKIRQLLDSVTMAVTNEEQEFISKHPSSVRLSVLDDRSHWVAQNLVRKGVYEISKDNNTLVNKLNETDL